MAWWFKGTQIKQPPIKVETAPKIRSFKLNDDIYLNYQDVINFLHQNVEPEVRWALDRAAFFK